MKFYSMAGLMISISFFSSNVAHCAADSNEQCIKLGLKLKCDDVTEPAFELSFSSPVYGLVVAKAVEHYLTGVSNSPAMAEFTKKYSGKKCMAHLFQTIKWGDDSFHKCSVGRYESMSVLEFPLLAQLEPAIEMPVKVQYKEKKVADIVVYRLESEDMDLGEIANEVADQLNTMEAFAGIREDIEQDCYLQIYNEPKQFRPSQGYPRFEKSELLHPKTSVRSLKQLALVARIEKLEQ